MPNLDFRGTPIYEHNCIGLYAFTRFTLKHICFCILKGCALNLRFYFGNVIRVYSSVCLHI